MNEKFIIMDNKTVKNWYIFNVDGQFRRFLNGEKFTGGCFDEAGIIDVLLKSIGIPPTILWHQEFDDKNIYGHSFAIYFNPHKNKFNAAPSQLDVGTGPIMYTTPSQLYIFRPPIYQRGYLIHGSLEGKDSVFQGNMFYMPQLMPYNTIKRMFSEGVESSQFKKWILYQD